MSLSTPIILGAVEAERLRQEHLLEQGRIPWDCADPAIPFHQKLSVLVEEVGEVARCLLEGTYRPDQLEGLRNELVQTAAVAVAWAESIALLMEDAA